MPKVSVVLGAIISSTPYPNVPRQNPRAKSWRGPRSKITTITAAPIAAISTNPTIACHTCDAYLSETITSATQVTNANKPRNDIRRKRMVVVTDVSLQANLR
jgi:hypothetical protein